ncbi:MAG TPA: apolipoprotein N-acyltransferase [Verrucomicrobiae bacterium]|jgi:apolipoprotein N-acyltransferase|nr:apolipoprotein N-acyltransferase [Verrucomicrobiae bacterium]
MQQSPAVNQVPLVVDLDGTLIKTDLLWETLARRLRRNPLALFPVLFWWTRGRAYLKQRLARRVQLNPAELPVSDKFLAWLREQKAAGRKLILATASDREVAGPVAEYFGIFDEVLASDGRANLRGPNKLRALVEKFGERGFDYAGNSSVDLAVWRGARNAIVVNGGPALQKKAAEATNVAATFYETNSSLSTLKYFLNELFIRSGYLIAAIAGLLLAITFPKVDFQGGAWIAPGLLAFAARNKSGGDAFRVGYLAGLVFWLLSLYWLLEIPYTWHSIPLAPGLGWVALCAVVALYIGGWTWALCAFPRRLTESWSGRFLWAIGGAAAWVALEMARGRILGGFPWEFLGASQYKMAPLLQIASITGIYGVSFLIVWVSLSLFSAVQMISTKPQSRFAWQPEIFPPLLVVIVLFAIGEFKPAQGSPPAATLRVALVQPSIPQNLIWDENANAARFQQLLQISETALTNKVDLLVWPESAVPMLDETTYPAITNLAYQHHVWIIFNSDDAVPRPNAKNEYDNDVYNAAFLVGPDGVLRFNDIYHKQKLVIFGEYVPLAWLPFMKWLTPVGSGFAAGTHAVQFDLTNLNVAASPLICFEDMFPQTARKAAAGGADFLINLTNDGWFGQSAEQWQHEVSSIVRAVEDGIPLVRCCNNGITCWIDAHGREREIFHDTGGAVYGEGTMIFDLPLHKHRPTFYKRHGDWFGWGCVGLTVFLLLSGFKASRNTNPRIH